MMNYQKNKNFIIFKISSILKIAIHKKYHKQEKTNYAKRKLKDFSLV